MLTFRPNVFIRISEGGASMPFEDTNLVMVGNLMRLTLVG